MLLGIYVNKYYQWQIVKVYLGTELIVIYEYIQKGYT